MDWKETQEWFIEKIKDMDARERLKIQIQIQQLYNNVKFYKFTTENYKRGYRDALKELIDLISKSASRNLDEMRSM